MSSGFSTQSFENEAPATHSRVIAIAPIVFGAVCGANVVAMSFGNFLEAQTSYLPFIYFTSLIALVPVIVFSGVKFPELSGWDHLLCVVVASILFLPRLPYLLESFLGYAVNTIGDDHGHIQELSSIIYSDRFPPTSTFDSSKYLSFYYAPWMLGAVLHWIGVVSTIKQALGICVFFYDGLIVYSALYASKILFQEIAIQRTFLILCLLYGGFDFLYWLSGLDFVPVHSEWWAGSFGIWIQFSNFITLALWVPHHFISVLSILFALYVVSNSTALLASVLAGILFVFAVNSSVFAVIGALPLVVWFFIKQRRFSAIPLTALTFAVFALPTLWIYVGKQGVGFRLFGAMSDFWVDSKRSAFLVFLLVLSLELFPIICAAFLYVRKKRDRIFLFAASMLYLLSTFFISFSGANNYATRGAIVPVFTLIFLAAPIIRDWLAYMRQHKWLGAVAISYLAGGVLEYTSFSLSALDSLAHSNTRFNVDALRSNAGLDDTVSNELVQRASQYPKGWYLLEKRKLGIKQPLLELDVELMNSDNQYRLTFARLMRADNDTDPRP